MPPLRRRPRTFALGVWLASRGGLVATSLVLAALGGFAAIAALLATGAGRSSARVATIASLASQAIAWSAGMTLAFAGALRALRRDRDEGVLALARARGVSAADYVRGRVGGLVAMVAMAVGGAAIAVGLVATAVAPILSTTARAAAASLAYALAFSATIGPVAMAALGARTRAGGYFALLAVLALPEILAPWTVAFLPPGWHELTSIPAALTAVRAGVASPSTAGVHMARALAALMAVIAASLAVVLARVRVRTEGA